MIELKSIITQQVLFKADVLSLRDAVVLAVRDGANLYGAYLYGAYLRGADLSGANLSWAKGVSAELVTPLLILLEQPGKIRAYKVVNANNEGHLNGGLKYEIGSTVSVDNAETDINKDCGAGIHVATLDWCLCEWREGYKILILEFEAKDIAAIPTATDGKFRLHRATVVGEKDISKLVTNEPNP